MPILGGLVMKEVSRRKQIGVLSTQNKEIQVKTPLFLSFRQVLKTEIYGGPLRPMCLSDQVGFIIRKKIQKSNL